MGGGVASTSDGSQLVGACVHAISTQVWWWCSVVVITSGPWDCPPPTDTTVTTVSLDCCHHCCWWWSWWWSTDSIQHHRSWARGAVTQLVLAQTLTISVIDTLLSLCVCLSRSSHSLLPHPQTQLAMLTISVIDTLWSSHSILPHPSGHDDNITASLIPSCLSLCLSLLVFPQLTTPPKWLCWQYWQYCYWIIHTLPLVSPGLIFPQLTTPPNRSWWPVSTVSLKPSLVSFCLCLSWYLSTYQAMMTISASIHDSMDH